MPEPVEIEYTRKLLNELDFEAELILHEKSGKTTEDAEEALGLESKVIIKCLLLKSKKGDYLGAIVRGSDRLNFKALESFSGYKGLRMASQEDIRTVLGFDIGGVPAVIFRDRNIPTYVDNQVLSLEYVVGSGGTEFYGLKFNPRQLTEKLGYLQADISQ